MVIINMKRSIALLITIATLLMFTSTQAATITVSTNRNPVGLNESFMLIFESDSSVDGEPDFSPLNKDFQILTRNSNSSMSIVNGKISSSKKWQLTALARRAGKLILPVIHFGKDQSQASFINVNTGSSSTSTSNSSQDIFIEVDVEPKDSYVQSEVIYTVRLFLSVATSNASLSEPGINGANAVIERLGEDSNFQTNRRGKRYNVVERRYAIYPQVSGDLTIEPVMFQGQINRNAFSLFDPFGPQANTIIERSMPITLEVKSVPDNFPGGHWLPAKNLTLTESWSQDPPQFRVGEPLTRTLTLVAQGQTASQLLELPEWVPQAFKQYPDQPTLSDSKHTTGITATRQEKVAIIPNKAGDYVLPEINIPWWNTKTNKLEYARIPERNITVAGIVPDTEPGMTGLSKLDDAYITTPEKSDIISDPISVTESESNALSTEFWQALSAALTLLWLVTLFLWWRGRAIVKNEVVPDKRAVRLKAAFKAVEKACREGDPNKLKQALLQWGQQVWPNTPPTSLGELGKRSPTELAEKIAQLNNNLYSQQKSAFDGDAFWQVFKTSHALREKQNEQATSELEPLYRL
ncbi:MAG: hypothetical protein ACI9SC_001367 [Gammaproteobacteria bacterium]|jgi:hypothetical protein